MFSVTNVTFMNILSIYNIAVFDLVQISFGKIEEFDRYTLLLDVGLGGLSRLAQECSPVAPGWIIWNNRGHGEGEKENSLEWHW